MRLARCAPEKRAVAAVAYVAAIAFLGLSAAACAVQTASDEPSVRTIGSAELSLTLPDNTTISSVGYKVTHMNGYSSDGSVPVANSEAITFQIGNIPAALGYKIELSASTSGSVDCKAGPMPFDITATQTALIKMTLRCGGGGSGSKAGNVRVDVDVETGGSGNGCAEVDGLTALPRSVKVGSEIDLRGYATSSSASFMWTAASGGTFSSATSATTKFKCESTGTHTITLSVTGGGTSCSASKAEIPLICTSGSGTGGSNGAGAGGTGSSGTGGTGASGGTGAAGTGTAGTGTSGTGAAGTGTAGTGAAGTGTAGTGTAGTGTAGTGAAGTGAAGTGAAGTGAAGTGAAGTGAAGTGSSGTGGGPSEACKTCRNTNCRDYQGSGLDLVRGCTETIIEDLGASASDATFLQQCKDYLACAKTNNCAYGPNGASDCYCGSADANTCIMNGPASDAKCVTQTYAAARSMDIAQIPVKFSDLSLPIGWAYYLLECDRDHCLTECGPGSP
jgi:hypothetical protein